MPAPQSCIYALSLDGETYRYVGMTARRLSTRMADHRRCARDGRRTPLYDWMRKHGVENVQVTVLAGPIAPDDLYDLEQATILRLREEGYNLLNLCDGGRGTLGRTHDEETRAKMRGRVVSPETRAKISEAARQRAPEMSERLRGRTFSDETRQKMSEAAKRRAERQGGAWNKGVPRTAEEKAKMSAGRKGKLPSAETRARMSAAHTGLKQSPETIAKRRASLAATNARKKAEGGTGVTVTEERPVVTPWLPPDPQILLEENGVQKYLAGFPREWLASSEGRRRLTRLNPLLFALLYAQDVLQHPETGEISLSQFHIDIAENAQYWARKDLEPKEFRQAWLAPRESGKSTWAFLLLPLWAAAHMHRPYIFAFASTSTAAERWLANFKRRVQSPRSALQKDYPDLCVPARRPGGQTDTDRQSSYMAKSGFVFEAAGITSTVLGANQSGARPSLFIFDDIEPSSANYSMKEKEDRLSLIREAIFPMGLTAVSQFVGTVTTEGAIMHDVVRNALEADGTAPEWVVQENIQTHYYPAIVKDDEGREQSLWPAKWSLEFLQNERVVNPRGYALNYDNQPVPANSDYWTPDMFRHDRLAGVTKHIISIDPAVTTKRNSDLTGIAVIGWSPSERKAIVRHTEGVKLSSDQLGPHIAKLAEKYHTRAILVESNQGGEVWRDSVLAGRGFVVELIHSTGAKELRWTEALQFWARGWVVHDPDGRTGDFEREAISVPKAAHDDVTDACSAGVRYLMQARRVPDNARKSSITSYI